MVVIQLRLADVPPPPCESCGGRCCTNNAHHTLVVALTTAELASFPEAVPVRLSFGDAMALPMTADGRCVHLKDGRCGIYERRPQACRAYSCVYEYLQGWPQLCGGAETLVDGSSEVFATIERKYPCMKPRKGSSHAIVPLSRIRALHCKPDAADPGGESFNQGD